MEEQIETRYRNETASLGFVQLPTLVLCDKRLTSTKKILYAMFLRYAGSDNYCFPGIGKIAKGLGLQVRQVYNLIKDLEDLGLITREQREGRSSVYWIEEMANAYGEGKGNRLRDDIISMLRESGEEKVVETILDRRDTPVGDDPKEGEVRQAGEKSDGGDEPQSKPRFEKVLDRSKEKRKISRAASEKRISRKKKLSQDPQYVAQKAANKAAAKMEREEELGAVESVRDVEDEWRVAAKETWPDAPSLYGPWDKKANPGMWRGITRSLCDRCGTAEVIRLVRDVIVRWQSHYVDEYGLSGYPSMNLVAAYADSWLPNIERELIRPRRKRGARDLRDYDEATGTKDGGISFL